ncbi:hypothetical protein KR054_000294 [Drosophila jambulina]|nr:hypothetical protein KR054_000294 [Drosophila jambulina]
MPLAHGITLGWFSPSLKLFFSNKNPFGDPMTINEATVAGSIVALGSLLVNLILGWPLDFFGRKIVMYATAVPNLINWILVYVGGHVACLYVARFLVGFSGGIMMVVLPIFIAEISDDNVRGTLSSLLILTMCAGIALGLIMATYISYYVMPFVVGAMVIMYVLFIFPLPETPQFLLKRGREEKALKSFYFYKNLKSKSLSDATKEAEAMAYFNTFRGSVLSDTQKVTCRDYFRREALKAFGLITILLLSNTFSGGFAVLNYASNIFSDLSSRIDPNTSGNVVGIFQLLGISCGVLLVDRVGRRWLLIPSLVGTGLGELTVGLLKSFASKKFLCNTGWLGLTLLCFVEYMVSLGVIPVTFVVIVELLPVKVSVGLQWNLRKWWLSRGIHPQILSVGTSLSVASYSMIMFVVLTIYPLMIDDYGVESVMFMSAGFCFLGAIVLGIFLPETKGIQILQ